MDKAEQPTIAQARYTVADYELAEQCVSAANVVTCDGYYEVDIEKVAETLAKARTTSLAAQDGLVAEIERQEGLVKTYRGAQLRAEEKLCREQANAQGWKRRAEILESKLAALSAIKEQHHD